VLLALPWLLQNANRKDDGVVRMEQKKEKNRISVYLQTRVALTMSALPNFIRKK